MIYDHNMTGANKKVVVAESGTMLTSPDQKYLVVNLINGCSYEEQNKTKGGWDTHPLMRNNFKSYIIRFDLSQFKLNRTNEDLFKGGQQMMNLKQLGYSIDSLDRERNKKMNETGRYLSPFFFFLRNDDFLKQHLAAASARNYLEPLPNGAGTELIYQNALNQARSVKAYLGGIAEDIDTRRFQIAKYEVEWHRKLTLSIACFILFLIGAPLGAIIRKGGMGMPLVVSIVFFLLYHVTSITGEKFVKEGILPPFQGMWLSAMVLLPIGLFLIYKATHDSAIFDGDAYRIFFRRIFKRSAPRP